MKITSLMLCLLCFLPAIDAQNQIEPLTDDLYQLTTENVGDLTILAQFNVSSPVTDFEWSADTSKLLIGTQEGLWQLDLTSQTLSKLLTGDMTSIRFVSGTSLIAMVDYSELVITIYDLDQSIPVRNILVSGNTLINQSGTMYASGGMDTVTVYDLQSESQLHKFDVEQYEPCEYACGVHSLAFSIDDSVLAFATAVPEVESAIINMSTGDRTILVEAGGWLLNFNNDSTLLASVRGIPGYIPDRVLLSDSFTGSPALELEIYTSSIAFSNSGKLLAVGAWDDDAPNPDEAFGFVYLFDIERLLENGDMEPVAILSSSRPPIVEFSVDDRLVAVSNGEGQFSIWGIPATP